MGNRASVLSSRGQPSFPCLAARGNVGLYVCQGTRISGVNPRLVPQGEAVPDADR